MYKNIFLSLSSINPKGSAKLLSFFESRITLSASRVVTELSSSSLNSFSSFYPVMGYCLFIFRTRRRRFRSRGKPYYFDAFKFVLLSHTNFFFPWFEASLSLGFYTSQSYLLKTRISQKRWHSTLFSFIRRFFRVSKNCSFLKYKRYSCTGLKFVLRGRYLNRTFCLVQRRLVLGSIPLFIKSSNNKLVSNSFDYATFTSFWGSSSVSVFWNYKALS